MSCLPPDPAPFRRTPAPDAIVPHLLDDAGAEKADAAETAGNPRARSAVLRVAEKLAELPA